MYAGRQLSRHRRERGLGGAHQMQYALLVPLRIELVRMAGPASPEAAIQAARAELP